MACWSSMKTVFQTCLLPSVQPHEHSAAFHWLLWPRSPVRPKSPTNCMRHVQCIEHTSTLTIYLFCAHILYLDGSQGPLRSSDRTLLASWQSSGSLILLSSACRGCCSQLGYCYWARGLLMVRHQCVVVYFLVDMSSDQLCNNKHPSASISASAFTWSRLRSSLLSTGIARNHLLPQRRGKL